MASNTDEPLRLVILGKTGVGKSHVGNVILGRDAFVSRPCATSVTKESMKAEGARAKRKIQVVDTPGVLDTDRDEKEVAKEILDSIYQSRPGPHAFLLVIQVGRFSQEELRAVKALQEIFGPEVADYMIVVFNRAQELQGETLESYVQGSARLKGVVKGCGERYVPIDNNFQNQIQVTNIIEKVDKLVIVNDGNYFSNDVYKQSSQESSPESFIARMLSKMIYRVAKFFKALLM